MSNSSWICILAWLLIRAYKPAAKRLMLTTVFASHWFRCNACVVLVDDGPNCTRCALSSNAFVYCSMQILCQFSPINLQFLCVLARVYLPFLFCFYVCCRSITSTNGTSPRLLESVRERERKRQKMKSKACCSSKGSGLSDNLCAKIAHNWQFILMIGILMHAIDVCNGHGRLIEPPSRSSAFRYGFQTPPNYNGEFFLVSFLILFGFALLCFPFCFQLLAIYLIFDFCLYFSIESVTKW